jgi:hypothetical protein
VRLYKAECPQFGQTQFPLFGICGLLGKSSLDIPVSLIWELSNSQRHFTHFKTHRAMCHLEHAVTANKLESTYVRNRTKFCSSKQSGLYGIRQTIFGQAR